MKIDRIYKDGLDWKGDVSGAMDSYPATGLLVVDDSQIPEPEPPIPLPVLTNIDNIDPNLAYSDGWYSGPTTAQGFHGNTLAYASVAGKTVQLIFDGTSIEVFCEKKTGHGSGTFQIDNQPPVTIPLGVAGPVGSTSVFKIENLPSDRHTFKLTVVGNGNVVFDYIKINGGAVPPVIPTPPGNTITVNPGQDLTGITQGAASGTTIRVTPGTYAVTKINVPLGVNMVAESRAAILSYNGAKLDQVETGILHITSGSRSDGKQTISGFTIKGNGIAAVGVMVDNRDNVTITDIRFEEFNFAGTFLKRSANSHIFNNSLHNCSWSSSGWASGSIQIMDLFKCSIHHNTATSDKISEGYALKAMGSQVPKGGVLEQVDIYSNNFDMFPGSNWNNNTAPNIGIELHDVIYAGLNIYDNDVRNTMSLASHVASKAGTRMIVDRNRFNMKNGAYSIELVCSNITIKNNTFNGASLITANYNPVAGQNNGHWTDQIFENNTVNASGPPPSWAGTHLLGAGGADMIIRNNTYNNAPSNTRIKHTGPTSASNIVQTGNTPTP